MASFTKYLEEMWPAYEGEGSAIRSVVKRTSLLEEVEEIDQHNRENEEQLQRSLQQLRQQTEDYEARLREYRDQLHQKQILNEKTYSLKILQMLEEYELMKERVNDIKVDNSLALADSKRMAIGHLALLQYGVDCRLNRLKADFVTNQPLRSALGKFAERKQQERMSKESLAEKYRRHRSSQHAFNALKWNWYNALMKRLQDQRKRPPKVIALNKQIRPCTMAFNVVDLSVEYDWNEDEESREGGDNVLPLDGNKADQSGSLSHSRASSYFVEELQQNEPLVIKIPAPSAPRAADAPAAVTDSGAIQHVHLNIKQQTLHSHGHRRVSGRNHQSPARGREAAHNPEQQTSQRIIRKNKSASDL